MAAAGKRIWYVSYADISRADGVHADALGYQQLTGRIVPVITPIMQELTGH